MGLATAGPLPRCPLDVLRARGQGADRKIIPRASGFSRSIGIWMHTGRIWKRLISRHTRPLPRRWSNRSNLFRLIPLCSARRRSKERCTAARGSDRGSADARVHPSTEMWPRFWKPLVIVIPSAAIVLAVLYVTYRLVDPLPPRHLAIAAGAAGSGYDNFARQYARILARHGVELEVRNSAGAVENLDLLRDAASGVQAALATFGITQPRDADTLYSLGGIFDAAIFIFYRNAEPITLFAQFRGKRLSIGMPGTALRSLILEVLKATDALDASTHLSDLDPTEAIDALIAGEIDVAIFPSSLDGILLQRALAAPGIRLMNVAQAEAIAKTVPGLKHVVLWRGLISLARDIPDSDIDLLASRNRLLVRKDLHPALQYLLLEAMREVHWPAGPFNRLGEFPAEQPNDLPLSPTAAGILPLGPDLLAAIHVLLVYLAPQPNRVLCHSGRRDADSRHWLRASLFQMAATFVVSTDCTGR